MCADSYLEVVEERSALVILCDEPEFCGRIQARHAVLLRGYELEDVRMTERPVAGAAALYEIVQISFGQPRLTVLQGKHLEITTTR